MTLDRPTIQRARDDVGVFAEVLVGQPLWSHQLDLARSPARIRSVCSGRQAGKTRTLAVIALHDAFSVPDRRVLIVSAGEAAAKDLLSECSMLASSPLLAGSVVDDERHQLTLSNGSTIRSVPASERQIRGKAVDLLVIDEAAFVSEEVWTAAKYTIVARPGSRVVLASTPWGRQDRFFAVAYRAGLRGEDGYASFHWPSTASPNVDEELVHMWRDATPDREYRLRDVRRDVRGGRLPRDRRLPGPPDDHPERRLRRVGLGVRVRRVMRSRRARNVGLRLPRAPGVVGRGRVGLPQGRPGPSDATGERRVTT